MGKEASRFTRQLVEGKKVRLEFDAQKRDKYGRLLAYLYLEDGTFVNARIVEAGYAQVMTIPPNVKYADTFVGLQSQARKGDKGLWRDGSGERLF
jgi:micrococcal nuclease